MAKPKTKQAKKAEWKGYHQVNLSTEDATAFDEWRLTQHVQFSDIDVLANNGYKISFNWDSYHEGVSATLYCTQAKMEWAGYTLTAWAADVEGALLLLFYKHYVMCEEIWDIAPDKPKKDTLPYGQNGLIYNEDRPTIDFKQFYDTAVMKLFFIA